MPLGLKEVQGLLMVAFCVDVWLHELLVRLGLKDVRAVGLGLF